MVVAAILLSLSPNLLSAQDINRTVEFEDYGFTEPIYVGARAAGLAGTYTAAGNDVFSLVYNPAGLSRIKRAELALGLQQERKEISNEFYGNPNSVDTRDGGVDGFGAAFPLPTYRGSLVLAFGVFREFSGVFDLLYNGTNERTNTVDNYLLQQTGSAFSYNIGMGIDLSHELSGGLSLVVINGTINTLAQYDFTYHDLTPTTSVFVKENVETSINGVGGRVGVQFFYHRLIHGGINFTTPMWMQLKGTGVAELTEYRDNAQDSFEKTPIEFSDRFLLPFRLNLGVAFVPGPFMFAAELGYADWTEASINRKRFRGGSALESTFREVFDYRFAVEYTLPWWPVRTRAGYALRPYPLEYLQADRIDNNDLTRAEIVQDPTDVTFGLGGLIGDMLTVEAAYTITNSERRTSSMRDKRTNQRFALSAAYRF